MTCRILYLLVLFGLIGAPLEAGAQGNKKPRFYIKLYSFKEPAGTKPSLKPRALALLRKLLGSQPDVQLELGPRGMTRAALEKMLKAKKLAGYELGFRVTRASHAMHPPQPGKVYKVLMVDVAVAIDMQKIPTNQMALAGEGSTQVGVETARLKEKERVDLQNDALDGATKQAVSRTLNKLRNPVITSRPKPSRRKKRRRRRRVKRRKK